MDTKVWNVSVNELYYCLFLLIGCRLWLYSCILMSSFYSSNKPTLTWTCLCCTFGRRLQCQCFETVTGKAVTFCEFSSPSHCTHIHTCSFTQYTWRKPSKHSQNMQTKFTQIWGGFKPRLCMYKVTVLTIVD